VKIKIKTILIKNLGLSRLFIERLIAEKFGGRIVSTLIPFEGNHLGSHKIKVLGNDEIDEVIKIFRMFYSENRLENRIRSLYSQIFQPICFVCYHNGHDKLIGYCIYRIGWSIDLQKFGKKIGFLVSIAINPTYQRYGAGRYLLESTLNYLKEQKIISIDLFVGIENSKAIRLYESVGFKIAKMGEINRGLDRNFKYWMILEMKDLILATLPKMEL
jgi:ribosomal protein S18 acetylase RimI-like enzyme